MTPSEALDTLGKFLGISEEELAQAMDSSEYSFGYIAGWAGGGDNARAAIAASGNAITMAAKKILDALNQEVAA